MDEGTYAEFRSRLDAEDKEGCVRYVLSLLDRGAIDIPGLYEDVLAPAAREQYCLVRERLFCIWEEHIRTSIIRTVLECCYPHLMDERRSRVGSGSRGRAIIVCPTEEYHELGARMTADFFTLCGFDVTFVGANTPQDEIVEAASALEPEYIGVSVTSSYNLVAARRALDHLREVRERSGGTYKIVVGGQAFDSNDKRARGMGADALAQTFDDICELTGSRL
ncbi:MAG: cobalamin B12-binding domain-containing protein [Chloroflexota bacterium]